MEENWLDLVELFEYKVSDVVAGREPPGGKRALNALHTRLIQAPISGMLLRRMKLAERRLRDLRPSADAAAAAATAGGNVLVQDVVMDLGSDDFVNETEEPQDEEGIALRALARRAWRADFIEELTAFTATKRNEPERPTLRLLYAALHNLDQYSQHAGFAADLNLSRFAVIAPVPGADDALARMTDKGVTADLARELAAQILDFHDRHPRLPLPDFEVLPYLRRLTMAVAEDPTAGAGMPRRGPTPRELEDALEAAKVERISPQAKSELVARLSAQLDEARNRVRDADNALYQERKTLRQAAQSLFAWLAERVPARLGGRASEGWALPKAVGASQEFRNLASPDPSATSVALRLASAGRVTLAGIPLGWRPVPEGWVLEVGGAEYPLLDGARVPFSRNELRVTREGDYCLVRVGERSGPMLEDLLAVGCVTASLMDDRSAFLRLRLADGAVAWMRDHRLERGRLGMDAAAKLAALEVDAIATLARVRAERLLERITRGTQAGELEEAFEVAAKAAPEEGALGVAASLAARVQDAALPRSPVATSVGEVNGEGQALALLYRGDPIRVTVAGQGITLKPRPDGSFTALFHGGRSYGLDDLAVGPVPGGYAVLAREGMRFLVGFSRLA